MQRKRKKKSSDYKNKYTENLKHIVSYGGYDLTKNFLIVAQDRPDLYPKPNSIIAISSDEFYLKAKDEFIDELDYYEPPTPKDRVFNNTKVTQNDGVTQARYLFVVDHITEDGGVVVYDDQDKPHTLSDEVMVVDTYYYMASSHEKTFTYNIDYNESILAIKMGDLYDESEICDIIDNDYLMYERIMVTLPNNVMNDIKDIYVGRGVSLKGTRRKIVRVCLERALLFGDNKDKGVTPFAVECLMALNNKGYHIDIMSNNYFKDSEKTIELQDWLISLGVVYDTWNNNYKYDFIVDSRNAMLMGVIDWTVIYENITGESLLDENVDDVNLNGYLQDATERFIDSVEDNEVLEIEDVVEDELSEQWEQGYEYFLEITKKDFIKNKDVILKYFPLAPLEWEIISNLQYCFKEEAKMVDLSPKYKELVETLGLTHKFNK